MKYHQGYNGSGLAGLVLYSVGSLAVELRSWEFLTPNLRRIVIMGHQFVKAH